MGENIILCQWTEVYKICKLYRLIYIFHILQHFATKLCNFTYLRMIFIAVVTNYVIIISIFFRFLSMVH